MIENGGEECKGKQEHDEADGLSKFIGSIHDDANVCIKGERKQIQQSTTAT